MIEAIRYRGGRLRIAKDIVAAIAADERVGLQLPCDLNMHAVERVGLAPPDRSWKMRARRDSDVHIRKAIGPFDQGEAERFAERARIPCPYP